MSAFEGRADMPQAWRDVRLWPRLCENGSARRSGARLIQTECRWRMKDSPRRQVRFFCCVLTTVGSVFTQPRPEADVPVILTPVAPPALGSFYFRRRRSDTPYNPNHPCATIFIVHKRQTKERFLPSVGGCSMRQDKPLHAVKRVATRNKNDSAKRKTVRRQKVFKTSNWYERAALSIKAAPSRA